LSNNPNILQSFLVEDKIQKFDEHASYQNLKLRNNQLQKNIRAKSQLNEYIDLKN
jgi:hypothetical protein